MRKQSLLQAIILILALTFCFTLLDANADNTRKPCLEIAPSSPAETDGAPCADETGPPAAEVIQAAKEGEKKASEHKPERSSGQTGIFSQMMAKDPSLAASPEIRPFGESVFSGAEQTAQENLPASPDYPVGHGDEIGVTFWGRVNGEHLLKVNRDGMISIPAIGPLNLNGLTFRETSELIKSKARAIIGAEVSVTMGRMRSMQVFVLGEVVRPGSHKLSATATVSNALMAAGGASPIGSLRKIELRRGADKPRHIDFYDLLLRGDRTGDLRLRDGDVVFVSVTGPVVGIAGNVKRPAMYELNGSSSLFDALKLSGGVIPTAYTQQVQVERVEGNLKRVVIDINAGDEEKARSFSLRDGDFVKVLSITGGDTNAVYLYGNVKRPGKYELKEGMKLSALIKGYPDLLEETHLTYAVVKRLTPELTTMVIPFNLGALISGSETDDIELKPLDSVFVFSTWLFKDRPTVTIEGEVRTPGRYMIEENMTVKDLVLMAGGLTEEASYGRYELYRKNELAGTSSLMRLNLGRALEGEAADNPVLSSSDHVRIHSALEAEPKRTVSVYGTVNSPGEYAYAENMLVSDLVFAGGGVKESAYLREAELASLTVQDKTVSALTYRTIDLEKALSGDREHDLEIKPYDSLFVRELVDWQNRQFVEIGGEVRFPGKYVIKKGEKLSSLIDRAGGFTDEAYLRGAVFTRESVRELQQTTLDESIRKLEVRLLTEAGSAAASATAEEGAKGLEAALLMKKELIARLKGVKAQGRISLQLDGTSNFNGTPHDIALEDGDRLIVPATHAQVQIMGAVQNQAAFVFEKDATVSDYIKMAGGYNSEADSKRIFILKSDGTAMSKNSSWVSSLSFMHSGLDPGDTIVVPEKIDRGLLLRETKDITQILYQIAVTAGVLIVAF